MWLTPPLGRDTLFNLGKVLRTHPEVNGFHGLRAALINAAAANPDGWTAIDVLRHFPTDVVHLDLQDFLALRQKLAVYLGYREAVVSAIQAEATNVAAQFPITQLPTSEPLYEAGPYPVTKETLVVEDPSLRQTAAGLTVNYDFPVDIYWPQGSPEPSPVVIISHGFGDVKETFVFMAEHLASHGFVVMVPEHVGSDLNYRQQYLQGRLNTLLSPMEFLNRPQEISFLIDELKRRVESDVTWANRLDLDNIGVMGDSLGGATALAWLGQKLTMPG
ncbi:MAG: alpha/beta hydrolase [Leptolyngbyaceae cyanobacterium SM2_5_2]|nr:alpha/beta hydrolase [Leptolyngbyaceae cyanobacterium SM2_5_2]